MSDSMGVMTASTKYQPRRALIEPSDHQQPYHGKAGEKRWRDVHDLPGRAA